MKPILVLISLCILSCGFEEKYDATASPFDPDNPLYDASKIDLQLSASAENGSVTLSWTPLEDMPLNLISGYNLYRIPLFKTDETDEAEEGQAYVQVSKDSTSYSDTNITQGTQYTYYITYFNGVDESDPSNEALAAP